MEVGKKTQRENTLVQGKEGEEKEEAKVKVEKLSKIQQAGIRRTDVLPSIFVVFDVTEREKKLEETLKLDPGANTRTQKHMHN